LKKLTYIVFGALLLSCEGIGVGVEEVVQVDLPDAKNLVTVEGLVTNIIENQEIRLSRSNSFNSTTPVEAIADATVAVQSRNGLTFFYSHAGAGIYFSDIPFSAQSGVEYRVRIQLSDNREIQSNWERMPELVALNRLFVDSFEENDPENAGQQIVIFYPRTIALDPENRNNFYRWRFFKNGEAFIDPESITIEDDRFFDGNLIPNNFRSFGYEVGDEMVVQFQSISGEAFDYLNLLKSQITSLGTSAGTTPAEITGNLFYASSTQEEKVFGYFGAAAISADTTVVERP